jgi:deazaflavin-dependent oxidoreductase (nitroreductase family)
MSDYNRTVIEEFRANGGKVGGPYEGAPLLLLTTTGARSGRPHTTPVMYLEDGDHLVVFATKGGAPTHPDWYHNLLANPLAQVEVGPERYEVRARMTSGAERDNLFALQAKHRPQFGEYAAKTTRRIPVISLARA